jgi:hypothetical protein
MVIENKYGRFSLCEHASRQPNEVAILIDGCRHVVQDGPFVERNPDDSLTEGSMDVIGHIVLEDHLEFCMGRLLDAVRV